MKRCLVGVGNYMMGDDAIGLHIAERFIEEGLADAFDVVMLPDSGVRLLDYFTPSTEKILIIDTVVSGRKPGEFFFFAPDEAKSLKEMGCCSTHEGDLLQTIELGRALGYQIPQITILGIEPAQMIPGQTISTVLETRVPEYIRAAKDHLLERSVALSRVSQAL